MVLCLVYLTTLFNKDENLVLVFNEDSTDHLYKCHANNISAMVKKQYKQGKVSNFVSLDVSAVYVLLVIGITNFFWVKFHGSERMRLFLLFTFNPRKLVILITELSCNCHAASYMTTTVVEC